MIRPLLLVRALREALLGRLPVDNIPDVLEVLCLAILVLKAVRISQLYARIMF